MKLGFLIFLFIALQVFMTIFAEEVYEHSNATLVFVSSLKEESSFSLLFNGRLMFIDGVPVEDPGFSGKLDRFQVQDLQGNDSASIQLAIQDAQKVDAGTYTLTGFSAEEDPVEESIDLVVFYAPSDLQCRVLNNSINCTLTNGYPGAGSTTCYQSNIKLISVVLPTPGPYQQSFTFEFDSSQGVKCCAESHTFAIPAEDCTQYTFYPTTGPPPSEPTIASNQTDKGATTSGSQIRTEVYIQVTNDNKAVLGFCCSLLFIVVVLYPFALIYHFKFQMSYTKTRYVPYNRGEIQFSQL